MYWFIGKPCSPSQLFSFYITPSLLFLSVAGKFASNSPSCFYEDNVSLQRCSNMADGTNYQGSHTSTHNVFKVIHGVTVQPNIVSNKIL